MLLPPLNESSLWKGERHLSIYDGQPKAHIPKKPCHRYNVREDEVKTETLRQSYDKYSAKYWEGVKQRHREYREARRPFLPLQPSYL